jgi:hypothetical protein
MNIYHALNQGDASIREPHLTSLLYYIFKETKNDFPNSSFLDFFIKSFFPDLPSTSFCKFDVETDLKIEEILINNQTRKDTDITIYLRFNEELNIINIENKISNLSFQEGQIEEQSRILKLKYPDSQIYNVLLLPYRSEQIAESNKNVKYIYWISEKQSLLDIYSEYILSITINQSIDTNKHMFLKICETFFQTFSSVLEQERLSSENMPRGPKNVLRFNMFQYLSSIADNWDNHFKEDPENVTVGKLLNIFEEIVSKEILAENPSNAIEKIAKFKRGALEAQPKIMTINEKNRIHFNITNSKEKQLFYYPDSPNGDYNGKWKNTRIKPLKRMNESNEYVIFWKNNQTNDIETSIYNTI